MNYCGCAVYSYPVGIVAARVEVRAPPEVSRDAKWYLTLTECLTIESSS